MDACFRGYKSHLSRRCWLWNRRAALADAAVRDEMNRLAEINRKEVGYQFARSAGIRVPEHRIFGSVAEALDSTLEDSFVLKPRGGHSSNGVYLLQREANGGFRCLMNNRCYDGAGEIVEDYQKKKRTLGRREMSQEVIIEEYVEDSLGFGVPLDYKVYSFFSGSVIVMQRYAPVHLPKERWAFQFYNRSGEVLGLVRLNTPSDESIPLRLPHNFSDLLRVADLLVERARVSFVRTDLFSTPKGITFGEFTPMPNAGREAFEPEVDELLGRHWDESLRQLGTSYFDTGPVP